MANKLRAITASAGAGKTTRIVRDIAAEVASRPPEEILATTFTIKAADELVERARAELFRRGQASFAARLLGARFGTVNAVCGQIVADFALDLGRSPSTSVIGEANEALTFSISADAAISQHAPELNQLADIFGYNDPRPPGSERPDWRQTVREILTLSRANGIEVQDLSKSMERSVATFSELWSPAFGTPDRLDSDLFQALSATVSSRPATPSAKAAKDLPTIQAAHQRASRGEQLPWSLWARLTKVACAPTKDGHEYRDAVAALVAAAGRHVGHPRLREDTERFIRSIFACAIDALGAYQSWKAERGLVDFTDQETLALQVLKNPVLGERLRERVGRVFVDEFQDSSPLQVAVFKALSDLVEESTWVGDPKQAIYGFRGSDTELTQAAFAGAGDDSDNILSVSWRSRPGIISFANALFGPAFERMGLPASQHAFSDTARSDVGFDRHPLAWWYLAGNASEQADALAAGLRSAIDNGGDWLVAEGKDDHRPLRAGDVAVLCRSNHEVLRFASAFDRMGLPVAVERSGLSRTPHVELVLAACRWVADKDDRLALAEMARFFSDDPESDAWLAAAAEDEADAALRAIVPAADALEQLRAQILNLTPAELIDAVLTLPTVIDRIEAWGDHSIRLDDLEALRGFGAAYEEECTASGVPATLQGLLIAIANADPKRPASFAANAIKVMTYHGAKGLEWPMTVLTGLSWQPRARLYKPVAETDVALDWNDPLNGRWIRYWPWPYGLSGVGGTLDAAAAASSIGLDAWARAVHEDTRLLYVGVTRARDYLVFAPPAKGSPDWLKVLDAPGEDAHVRPPTEDDNVIEVGGETFVADVRLLTADALQEERYPAPTIVTPRIAEQTPRKPLFIRPSSTEGGNWIVSERMSLGGRLPVEGIANFTILGEALHGILAYDDPARATETRTKDAEAILKRWRITGFSSKDALVASDRLHRKITALWPTARLRREAPIAAQIGQQLVQGRIDLLVETNETMAIIDHKSFPGRFEQWEAKALQYAPQVGIYGEAVQTASGRPCNQLFIHMPIVGALLRLSQAG